MRRTQSMLQVIGRSSVRANLSLALQEVTAATSTAVQSRRVVCRTLVALSMFEYYVRSQRPGPDVLTDSR